MEDIGIFGMIDFLVSDELGVSRDVYIDVIDKKCTYWEAIYIVTVFYQQVEEKKDKAREIFYYRMNGGNN
jgi:hypothetical protein